MVQTQSSYYGLLCCKIKSRTTRVRVPTKLSRCILGRPPSSILFFSSEIFKWDYKHPIQIEGMRDEFHVGCWLESAISEVSFQI